MGNDTNKYGINTHENKSMSNLNCFNYQENSPNIYLFPYMVHEHHFFFSLNFFKKKKKKEMSSLPQGFLLLLLVWQNFPIEKISHPIFIFKADSIYVAKYPLGWSWGCWFGADNYDAGFGLMTLGSFCWTAALEWLGSKSNQLIVKLYLSVHVWAF